MSRQAAPPKAGGAGTVRFGPRVDRWMLGVVGAAFLATLVAGVAPAFDPAASARDLAVTMGTSLTVIVLAVALTVPVRYEMSLNELRLRCGVVRQRITLDDVVRVETHVSPFASRTAPWTARRVRIVRSGGRRIDVGPADRTGFMAELLARAPQLEERRVGGRRVWLDPERS